jgi:folylpolyglutamate synthase/dihydropteroate synthase
MLAALVPMADAVVCTQAGEPRSLAAEELARIVDAARRTAPGEPEKRRASHLPLGVRVVADPAGAVAAARELAGPGGAVLVTGSLYLLEDLAGMLADAAEAQRPV